MSDGRVRIRKIGGSSVRKPSTSVAGEDGVFNGSNGLEPRYDIEALLAWREDSHALPPNIAAYASNIDGFGHRVEPAIDPRSESADADFLDAIFDHEYLMSGTDPGDPSPSESKKLTDKIRRQMRMQKSISTSFFENCVYQPGVSFADFRQQMRTNLEFCGNAYWEVMRNKKGVLSRFKEIPPHLVRLMPLAEDFTLVDDWERTSPLHHRKMPVKMRTRRAVYRKEVSAEDVYLKQFGDRRVMDAMTGEFYPSVDAMLADSKDAVEANEYIHFKIGSALTPYGVPRWIGSLQDVRGLYKASNVNLMLFDNNGVPPMAILVSGGVLADGAVQKVESMFSNELKGNFDKILVIEASSDGKGGNAPRIEIVPLIDAQQKDARFLDYDERGSDKIGGQFRVTRILRGDTRDFNRATATAAVRTTEDQVFAPIRNAFDWMMNQLIMPAIGCSSMRYVSQTPTTKDPEVLSKIIDQQVRAGTLMPKDGRRLLDDAFNTRLPPVDQPWMDKPIALTLADTQNQANVAGGIDSGDVLKSATDLLGIKARIDAAQAAAVKGRMDMAREYLSAGDLEESVIKITSEEMGDLLK